MEKILINIFNKINIPVNNLDQLNNNIFNREIFISRINFNNVTNFLYDIRATYNGKLPSNLTNYSINKQRWPLLNLIRQTLKLFNYKMVPIRVSKKKCKDKKREYERFFKIIKN